MNAINKIYSYPNTYNINRLKKNNVSFKSNERAVYDDNFVHKYNTSTYLFRGDMKWKDFAKILFNKFKKAPKVNIIDYACSSGEEAVSLAIILDKLFGEKAEKFFPICAYDIDSQNISMAKSGIIKANKDECEKIKQYLPEYSFNPFFSVVKEENDFSVLITKKKLREKIVYKQSDITKDVQNIPGENTVLLCRNFWPYLTLGEQEKLAKDIAKQLKPHSLIVLGAFDTSYGIEKYFEKLGFKHTKDFLVMEKMPVWQRFVQKMARKIIGIK